MPRKRPRGPHNSAAGKLLSAEDRTAALGLLDGLVGGLVRHNLTLIDPSTGAPTTWGKWSPAWLNQVRDWSDNRGLRALELLSYLAMAEEVTGDHVHDPHATPALSGRGL